MKTKITLLISLLYISCIAFGSPAKNGFMVKFILIPNNIEIPKGKYHVKDIETYSKELKKLLSTSDNYSMGSTYITNSSTGSYQRVFNQKTFGYNEVELSKKMTIDLGELSFSVRFSSKKDISFTECPEIKYTCSLDSAYFIQVPGNTEHKLLLAVLPKDKPSENNRKITPKPLQLWIKQIAIDRKIDTTLTKHIPSDPALVAFCKESKIREKMAILKQAVLIINEGKTYIVIKAKEIKEEVDKPLNWVRAWEKCILTIDEADIERFSFEKPNEPGETLSFKNELTITDCTGAEITLKVIK